MLVKSIGNERQCLSKQWVVWGVHIVILRLESLVYWAFEFKFKTSLLASFWDRDGVTSFLIKSVINIWLILVILVVNKRSSEIVYVY